MDRKKILITPFPRLVKGYVRKIYYFLKKLQYLFFILPFSKIFKFDIVETDLAMYPFLKKINAKFFWLSEILPSNKIFHEDIEIETLNKIEELIKTSESSDFCFDEIDIRPIVYVNFYYSVRDSVILTNVIKEINDNTDVYLIGKNRYSGTGDIVIKFFKLFEITNFPEHFFGLSVLFYYILKKYFYRIKNYLFYSQNINDLKSVTESTANKIHYDLIIFEPEFNIHKQHLSFILQELNEPYLKNFRTAIIKKNIKKYRIVDLHSSADNENEYPIIRNEINYDKDSYNKLIFILDYAIKKIRLRNKSICFNDEELYFRFLIKDVPLLCDIISIFKNVSFNYFFSVDAWGPIYRFLFYWIGKNRPNVIRLVGQHGLTINQSFPYWKMEFEQFFAWGEYDKNHLTEYWKYPSDKVHICGCLNQISTKNKKDEEPNKYQRGKTILILTQYPGCALSYFEDQSFRIGIADLIKEINGYKIFIKHHPNTLEEKVFFKEIANETNQNEIIITNEPVSNIAKRCLIAITCSSTSIIEAMEEGCIPILFNPHRRNSALMIEKTEPMCLALTSKDLINKVEDITLNDKILNKQQIDKIKKYYIPNEGKQSAEFFFDFLLSHKK